MVYHGPSQACAPCRLRKIRCDLRQPICHNCQRRRVICPGPRLRTAFEFRDEFDTIIHRLERQKLVKNRTRSQIIEENACIGNDTTETTTNSMNQRASQLTVASHHFLGYDESLFEPIRLNSINLCWSAHGKSIRYVNEASTELGDDISLMSTLSCTFCQLPVPGSALCSCLNIECGASGQGHEFSALTIRRFVASISPLTALGNGNSDPFNASAISLNAIRHSLLLYWRCRFLLLLWPSFRGAKLISKAETGWIEDCRQHLDNSLYLNGIMASVLACLAQHAGDTLESHRMRYQSMIHHGECLSIVRQSLSSRPDFLRLISGIWAVSSISFVCGDMITCRVHLCGMKNLVRFVGGIHSLSQIVAYKILLWDSVAAVTLLERPIFPASNWYRGSIQKQQFWDVPKVRKQVLQVSKNKAGRNINRYLSHRLSRQLRIHKEVLSLVSLADEIASVQPNTASEIYQYVQSRRGALRASDLNMYCDIAEAEEALSVENRLEACLCLAIDFCHQIVAHPDALSVSKFVPIYHLRARISDLLLAQNASASLHSQLAITYSFFVGACAEQIVHGNRFPLAEGTNVNASTDNWWHSSAFRQDVKAQGISRFTVLQHLFDEYLYDSKVLDPFLAALLIDN